MGWSTKKDTRKLDSIIRGMDHKTEQILSKTAFDVKGIAANLAPVDTGALQNSIHVTSPRERVRIVADAVEYGIYQELGTSRMAAQPFMVPAFNKVRKPFRLALKALYSDRGVSTVGFEASLSSSGDLEHTVVVGGE